VPLKVDFCPVGGSQKTGGFLDAGMMFISYEQTIPPIKKEEKQPEIKDIMANKFVLKLQSKVDYDKSYNCIFLLII
jgi:hypothetical protein